MKRLAWLVLLLFSASGTIGQAQALNAPGGMALEGFDPVSYFKEGPVRGDSLYTVEYHGARYFFANPENRAAFLKNPGKYLPKYGGWCAYAMALNGEKVTVDPETYKIIRGQLYLFYNSFLNNTLKKWNKKEASYLPRAEMNWKSIK